MSADLEKVMQNGWALEYVEAQTSEICLAAVKQNGYALKFVKEQTPEICLAAVKQDGGALACVAPEIIVAAFNALIARGRNKRSATNYWQGAVTHLEVVIDENGVCNAVAALAKAVENIKEDAHPESSLYANLDFVQNVLDAAGMALDIDECAAGRKERQAAQAELQELLAKIKP